jgi:predicted transposase YbfD/YdcC
MKRCTDNVMTKWKDVQTMQWPFGHYIVCTSFHLVITLSVHLFIWSLHCLYIFSFGHCIVCTSFHLVITLLQWPNEKMYRQCNDQMKRCTDNVMTKWKDVQTMQWPNEKMYRQCNDQMKRCTDNTMTLSVHLFIWSLHCLYIFSFGHYIVCTSFHLVITLSVHLFIWSLHCLYIFSFGHQMKRCTDNVMTKWKDVQTM